MYWSDIYFWGPPSRVGGAGGQDVPVNELLLNKLAYTMYICSFTSYEKILCSLLSNILFDLFPYK